MQRLTDLEARIAAVEAELLTYKTVHSAEHRQLAAEAKQRHSQLSAEIGAMRESFTKSLGDLYATMGNTTRDLGNATALLREQGQRLGEEAGKIRFQGQFLAKIGLLVVFGAAVGGGAIQGGMWWWSQRPAVHAAPLDQTFPPRCGMLPQ